MQNYPYMQPPAPLPLTPPEMGLVPPERPTLTNNGLSMTPKQFQACRVRKRPTLWLLVTALLVLGMLSLSATSLMMYYGGATEGSMITAVVVLALSFIMMAQARRRTATRQADENAWRLYAAATEGGLVTTVYDDRVEQRSVRWCDWVLFDQHATYTETEELMILENGDHRVVWRAEDLTPEEAQAIYERICLSIPSGRQFASGRFYAKRHESAPPPFRTDPPMCYERFQFMPGQKTTTFSLPHGMLLWLFAASLVFAALFATLFEFSFTGGAFVPDFLIFLTAFFAVSAAITVWLLRKKPEKAEPITLSFTGDGLHILCGDRQQFVAARDVHAHRTENGALMVTPAGNIAFPWNVTHNRQQLEWMLFSQPSSPYER